MVVVGASVTVVGVFMTALTKSSSVTVRVVVVSGASVTVGLHNTKAMSYFGDFIHSIEYCT